MMLILVLLIYTKANLVCAAKTKLHNIAMVLTK